ncbi:hypothetical protein PAI11_15210 [Patulibacter medicamentivorans]|uniref:Uncharacterized protein n=1 Tax=Patulibacter medicamentivorans TaxID=1097667 RepID=H0E3Z5_9ACTN|nr:hypothetical protein [Patulibacter medicamentivorans]EHN11601.1 hypothetical protein PAI11_15210 [Patulibacter medicamentivorans]
MTRLASLLAVLVAALLGGAGTAAAATWQPYPLPAPPGGQFPTPAGYVSDLSFWAPNRGLMAVSGNAAVPAGIYVFDGERWRQLSTVCGGGIDARIAWAGPTEFWVISTPSGRANSGQGLCRFKDGEVVGSYALPNVPGFDDVVWAAACRAADDCWFGGRGGISGDGSQAGALHLHWDGRDVRVVYGPQGRGVSDLHAFRGRILESTHVGVGPDDTLATPPLLEPEATPALLHGIDGTAFRNDPFVPAPLSGVRDDAADLRAIDSDGTTAWAVGGRTLNGPAATAGPPERPPLVARLGGDGSWRELTLTGPAASITTAAFGDVAVLPGGGGVWTTVTELPTAGLSTNGEGAQPRVALLRPDGSSEVHDLAGPADPLRGAATRIACPTAGDCWLATARGYLYRWTDGASYPVDGEPAFQGLIATRPNEAAAQVIPDAPPDDDALRNQAPPLDITPLKPEQRCGRPPAIVTGVRKPLVRGLQRRVRDPRARLVVRFRVTRRARVQLLGKRGRRTVAKSSWKTFAKGRRSLQIQVRRSRWPKQLAMRTKELGTPPCAPLGGGDDATLLTRSAPSTR